MHMAGGDAQGGGRQDARASCASPLGTPLRYGIKSSIFSIISVLHLDSVTFCTQPFKGRW
jgi:hypothetical protein